MGLKGKAICKICGKEYLMCKPVYYTGVDRWQDVACCPEHGLEYFERVKRDREEEAAKESGNNK